MSDIALADPFSLTQRHPDLTQSQVIHFIGSAVDTQAQKRHHLHTAMPEGYADV